MRTMLNINGFETPVEIPTDFPSKYPEKRDNVIDYGNGVLRIYGETTVNVAADTLEGFTDMKFMVGKILHVSLTALDVPSVQGEAAHVADLRANTFTIVARANKATTVRVAYAVDALVRE